MENNKNKKSVKFQGDVLNFCDFIQVFVFTRNHHLKWEIEHGLCACTERYFPSFSEGIIDRTGA